MKRNGLLILIILVMTSCSRTYKITTDSMSNTFNVGQVLEPKEKASLDRGDIVLFRKNQNSGQETWVLRVVAFSGDTVEIKDGEVIINNKPIKLPSKGCQQYLLITSATLDVRNFRQNSIRQISENRYIAFLTMEEFNKVSIWQNVTEINRIISSSGENTKGIVKNNFTDKWNADQFGPLYIPSPKEKVKINGANIGLFNCLLPDLLPDSTVIVNEKLFFLMGDNRSNASDSRFIGLVTGSSIIGTVVED